MTRRLAITAAGVALVLCASLATALVVSGTASAHGRGHCHHESRDRGHGHEDDGCDDDPPTTTTTVASTTAPPTTAPRTTAPPTTAPPTTVPPTTTPPTVVTPTTVAPAVVATTVPTPPPSDPAPAAAVAAPPRSTTTTTPPPAVLSVEEVAAPVEAPAEVLGAVQLPAAVDEPTPEAPTDDLSDVSTGIPTTVDFTPTFIASNVGFGALLVLVLVAASQLFNDALKMHHDRIASSLAGRSTVLAGAGSVIGRLLGVHPLVTFALAAGTLGLLADPSVSFNAATIGQILGMAVGLGVIVAVYELPAARRIERESGQHEAFRLFPIAIVIAIACLLFSRIFGVAPGVLYGLFAGVLFTTVDTRIAGRAYARSSILLAAAAMGAWGVHRLVDGAATGDSPSIWAILFDTAAAVIFVGGLQSVIVQLLPMPFTYGEMVVKWSRAAWAALFVASLALYMQFVVRPNPDAATWSNLWFVGAFLAVAFGFWGYCAVRRWSDARRAAAEADAPDEVPATGG